jgi:eukaryotic-like serine/threonine-protein kinase
LSDSGQSDEALATLLLRWEEAWEQGQDIPAEKLCLECPQLVEQVRSRITALKQMAWMTKSDRKPESIINAPDPLLGRTLADRYRIVLATVQNGGAGESSRRLKLAARNGVFW